jgi:penicillin-binding protein 1A
MAAEQDERRDDAARRRRRLARMAWRWTRRLFMVALALFGLGSLGLAALLDHYEDDLPSTAELKNYQPPQVTRVLARDGTLLAELFVERRTVVSIDDIAKEMKLAALAAEDADFYRHEGLDYLGMLRALLVNVRHGRSVQGGSTITQQVVKNVLLTPERTFARKAREVLLARRIEQELTKDEILELYLNHIYLGHGRYGVEEAARYYFGKSVKNVTLPEAALIAGLAKGPSIYSPRVDMQKALARRNAVLDQMAEKMFASQDAVDAAKAEPIALAPAVDALPELAPEVIGEVQQVLHDVVGPAAARGGFTVTTTIDPKLQVAARESLRASVDEYMKRQGFEPPLEPPKKGKPLAPFQGTPAASGHHVYHAVVKGADDPKGDLLVGVGTVDGVVHLAAQKRYNKKGLPPSKFAAPGTVIRVSAVLERGLGPDGVPREFRLEMGPQGAVVALDVATREIRALVGSYEAVRGGLDRASHSQRQPGSTFKPFVYGYGVHNRRLTPATVVPIERPPAKDGAPAPPLLVRLGLALSVNEAASWAFGEVGGEGVVDFAKSMGIHSTLQPTPSLALGAYEVTPRELASAYAVFAAGGSYEDPILVARIVGPDGAEIALPPRPAARRVIDEPEAYVMTSLLTSVVRDGTARKARSLEMPLAGKTGTSNEAKDTWFAGYSTEMLCVVWTGFDDAVPLGKGESGAVTALPAWISFMKAAHPKKPAGFVKPEGVVEVAIDPVTGMRPYDGQTNTITEVFLAGTEPTEAVAAPPPEDPYADLEKGTLTASGPPSPPDAVPPAVDAPPPF